MLLASVCPSSLVAQNSAFEVANGFHARIGRNWMLTMSPVRAMPQRRKSSATQDCRRPLCGIRCQEPPARRQRALADTERARKCGVETRRSVSADFIGGRSIGFSPGTSHRP